MAAVDRQVDRQVDRLGSGDQPVILVAVANGQPEAVGEGMIGREGARDEAAPDERCGDRGGRCRVIERNEQEVRHARLWSPTGRQERVGQAAPLTLHPGQVGREDVRVAQGAGDHRDRDRRDRAGRPVRLDPGQGLAPGDGKADAQAGQGVGLARRADHHQARIGLASRHQAQPHELAVRLVQDDDRGLATGKPGVLCQLGQETHDQAIGLEPAGWIVGVAQPDHGRFSSCGADGRAIDCPAFIGPKASDADHPGTALLADDPVHGIARRGDHGDIAGSQERLGHEVEDLVGARPNQDLVGRHGIDEGGRLGQAPVVGRRVLGQAGLELAPGQEISHQRPAEPARY